jgi:tetratricopeptide (TPR) repeat protein
VEQEIDDLEKEEMNLAQELFRDFPNNDEAIVLIGNLYRKRGNTIEAVRLWEQALQMNPHRLDVYRNIGLVALEKEEYEKAVNAFKKGLEIDRSVSELRSELARAFMETGRYAEVIELIEKEAESSPPSDFYYFLLGQAYYKLKDFDKAKYYYEKTIELRPDHTHAFYGLSSVCAKLQQPDKAKEYMAVFTKLKAKDMEVTKHRDQAAIGMDGGTNPFVELAMGAQKLYQKRGDLHKAEELLKKVTALEPENVKCLEDLASIYAMSNRIPAALAYFEEIKKIEPANVLCYVNIGILSTELKKITDAEQAFQKVIELAPEQSFGYRYLARLYLMTNKAVPEAVKLAEKAVALEATADNYFVLSWACDMNGNAKSALAAIEQAVKLEPDNPKYKQIYEIIKKKN